MTTLLVPGTAKTSLAIATLLSQLSHPYLLSTRSPSKPPPTLPSTTTPHPTLNLDLTNPSTWSASLSQPSTPAISTLYLLPPPTIPDFVPVLTQFIHTALTLLPSLHRIVFLSSSMITQGGPAHGQIHALLHQLASEGKLREYTILRPTWFAQNFVAEGGLHKRTVASEGRIYSATQGGRVAFVGVADVAGVAAAVIRQAAWGQGGADTMISVPGVHTSLVGRGREYIILGPTLHSYADVADILARCLGRRVEWVGLTVEELARKLVENLPIPEAYAPVLAGLDRLIAEGEEERLWERERGGCVQGLLGRRGREVEDVLRGELG